MNDYKLEQRINCVIGCILAVASVIPPIIKDPQVGWWPWVLLGVCALMGLILLFAPYKPEFSVFVSYQVGLLFMVAVFVASLGISMGSVSEKKYPSHKVVCENVYEFKGHVMMECNEGRFEVLSGSNKAAFIRPGDTLVVQIKGENMYIRNRR
ncbi:MAG: hypothetical protein J6S61_04635 [Elusimicrobiaceae bacterium]|nr:hypothetical protein [Elusimicrobiaceae bacterium]